MNWKVKAFLQRSASRIPFGIDIYFAGQTMIGGKNKFRLENRLPCATGLIDCLVDQGKSLVGMRTLEIGTGWAPILPVFFWLYGVKECHTYDQLRLLKPALVAQVVQDLEEYCSQNKDMLASWSNRDLNQEGLRVSELKRLVISRRSSKEILEQCGISYHAPADASKTGLPDGSIDLVFSNLVLGEIPMQGLDAICREAYRVLRPGGLMLHHIDLGDQFADAGQGISTINFLQYSEKEFAKYNSPLNYQNRLRAPAYKQLFEKHNFEVIDWRARVDKNALMEINNIKINSDFASFSPDVLCTTELYVLGKRLGL